MVAGLLFATVLPAGAQEPHCTPVDMLRLPLTERSPDPAVNSVLLAYSGVTSNAEGTTLTHGDRSVPIEGRSRAEPAAALDAATFGDQFRHIYPLDASPTARDVPWFDPGRLRNAAFMAFLYFDSKAAAQDSLVSVRHEPSNTTFRVTRRHGVACQLSAAIEEIGTDTSGAFRSVGGSFSWRRISGTNRLSVHSYGAAVDLNADMGGYWKWAGEPAGQVGLYSGRIPARIVQAFERFGFIWGGKWHHYDGMHFEYRPELILYARQRLEDSE